MSAVMMAEMAILALFRCCLHSRWLIRPHFHQTRETPMSNDNEQPASAIESSTIKKLSNAQIKHDAANEVKLGEIPSSVVRDKCFFQGQKPDFSFPSNAFALVHFDLAPPSIPFLFCRLGHLNWK